MADLCKSILIGLATSLMAIIAIILAPLLFVFIAAMGLSMTTGVLALMVWFLFSHDPAWLTGGLTLLFWPTIGLTLVGAVSYHRARLTLRRNLSHSLSAQPTLC